MPNVRVIGSNDSLSSRIRIGTYDLVCDDEIAGVGPRPIDLLLAGLGGCTVATVKRCAIANGWSVDGVYVELAMHGTPPFQAIGQRIWIDGRLTDRQMAVLGQTADESAVSVSLTGVVDVSSRVDRFPRPDLSRDGVRGTLGPI